MKNLPLLLLLSIVLLAQCSPKYYSPNTQNVPLITQRNETVLTVTGNKNQVEFQGAYGLSKNFALQANGAIFIPAEEENGNRGRGKLIELGGGYYKALPKNLVFEGYGIFGLGKVENHLPTAATTDPETFGNISATVLRYGVQPNFGFKSKYFSAALSSRVVILNYSNITGDLIFEEINQVDYLIKNNNNLLFEPAITIRGGIDKFKAQLQYGRSVNLSNQNFSQDDSYLTLGLNFNFR